jgi:hypothetical protein
MDQAGTAPNGSRRNEDIALDLLKFVAGSAGLGKSAAPGAGFAPSGSKPEDQVNQLLALYSKCLSTVQGK